MKFTNKIICKFFGHKLEEPKNTKKRCVRCGHSYLDEILESLRKR